MKNITQKVKDIKKTITMEMNRGAEFDPESVERIYKSQKDLKDALNEKATQLDEQNTAVSKKIARAIEII